MAAPLARRVTMAGLAAGCVAVLPFAGEPLGHGTALVAAAATTIVLCDLLAAGLLLARFLARGSALPLLLGCAFLAAGVLGAAHAIVLPGLGAGGDPAHGAGHAPAWLWAAAHAGLPLGLALAIWGGPASLRRRLAAPTLRRPLAAAVAAALTALATGGLAALLMAVGADLPTLDDDGALTGLGIVAGGALLALDLGVVVLLTRRGRRSPLERRLPLAAGCVLAGTALTLAAQAPYAAGWYAASVLDLLAAGIVLASVLADPAHLARAGAADASAGDRDPLTGVASRAAALVAAEHLRRTRPPGAPLAVILVDVDALRAIQDAHGALAGDAVLLTVARRLRAELRDEDVLARAGEEGFLIILPGTDLEGATLVADRAVAAIREQPVGTWSYDVRTTLSGGVAVVGEGEDAVAQALATADLALNQAKAHGRDQVVSPARALVVPLRRASAESQPG